MFLHDIKLQKKEKKWKNQTATNLTMNSYISETFFFFFFGLVRPERSIKQKRAKKGQQANKKKKGKKQIR